MNARRSRAEARPQTRRSGFAAWRRERPFWGAVLVALSGIELFFSGQLDIGKIHIQLGLEGLQAFIIPMVIVLLGVLIALMPVHRIFYGVIALALALYSLIGVNLGGFIIGMLLGAIGGVLAVSWMPPQREPEPMTATESEPESESESGQERSDPRPGQHLYDEDAEHHAQPVIPPSLRRRSGVLAAVAAVTLALVGTAPQAARAAEPAHPSAAQAGCVLLIFCSGDDSSSSPTPSASSTPSPSASSSSDPTSTADPSGGGLITTDPDGDTTVQAPDSDRDSAPDDGQEPVTKADDSSPADDTPLVSLGADNSHGIFTLPSADVTASTAQIGGISNAGIVTVPLADGTRATAIRVECSSVKMDGFELSTLNRGAGVQLDTDMVMNGHVVLWINRVGTKWGDGEGLEQSLKANPLTLHQLLTLFGQGKTVIGLLGAQADTLTYTQFHEQVHG